MTIQSDNQEFETYLPVYDTVPEGWEQARQFFIEQLKRISIAVNIREIGWLLDEELLSGQQFIPGTANTQTYRSVFRKVVNFGSLPASATKSVAHGITFNAMFTLLNLYISATDQTGLTAFSLQYWSKNDLDSIRIDMDNTNINVITTADYSNFNTSFVVIEYIQEL